MIRRGCYYAKNIRLTNRSDGSAVPVLTWQFEAHLRGADGEIALELSTAGGHFTAAVDVNGIEYIRFALTEDDTTELPVGPVSAEVYRTDAPEGRKFFAILSEQVRDQV